MRVHIFGSAAKRRFTSDIKDIDEVWTVNGLHTGRLNWLPFVTRTFNLHRYELLKLYGYNFEPEREWAQQCPEVPLITMDPWPDEKRILNQQVLPLGALELMPRGKYHCGSFDWMVACAILEKADTIVLHGINLCLEVGEPISARACLEYWCGVAEGQGITVVGMPDTDIFHFYHVVKSKMIYGLDDTPIFEDRTRPGEPPYDYRD